MFTNCSRNGQSTSQRTIWIYDFIVLCICNGKWFHFNILIFFFSVFTARHCIRSAMEKNASDKLDYVHNVKQDVTQSHMSAITWYIFGYKNMNQTKPKSANRCKRSTFSKMILSRFRMPVSVGLFITKKKENQKWTSAVCISNPSMECRSKEK